MMPYLEEIKVGLRTLKPELSARFHVSAIGIFGSVVRSDFSPFASDIDIIVDFSQPIGVEFIDLAYYLEDKLHRKIDLVSKRGIKPQYYYEIEKDIIYV
ncbi:MAG: nucleotidyltransferase family protein [Prevotellaceae bacterium]|jgi:predicted nucleotidyltransferase|nr:nucleotidyltransferase family protein [Prevotellaceae bacterium]